MLQNFGWQGIVFSQLFQHLFIGAARTRGGFFDDRQAQFVEKDFAQLFRRRQVEGLARNRIRILLELHDALAQAVALRSQGGRIYQHAVALDAVQRLAAVHLQLVNKTQLLVSL